jgi:hypothetical protein
MYSALIVLSILALIVFGLYKSTENLLAIRQELRDQGEDPNIYL